MNMPLKLFYDFHAGGKAIPEAHMEDTIALLSKIFYNKGASPLNR